MKDSFEHKNWESNPSPYIQEATMPHKTSLNPLGSPDWPSNIEINCGFTYLEERPILRPLCTKSQLLCVDAVQEKWFIPL